MKKVLLLATILFIAAGAGAQSCTPDVSITASGIYPDTLPMGNAGQPYAAVVQFRIPADTNVELNSVPIYAVIDSFKVVDVQGLPPGLTYNCEPQGCGFPGGETSCARVHGTIESQAGGFYSFVIPVIFYGKIGGNLPAQLPDTIYRMGMEVSGPNSVKVQSFNQLLVYPNPAGASLIIAAPFSISGAGLRLFDQQGRAIDLPVQVVQNRFEVNTSTLPPGLYYGVVSKGEYSWRVRFVVS